MSSKLIMHLSSIKHLPHITLGKLADVLKEEAIVLVCLISIIPFMQPIPIPGLSSLLGLIALMQGFGLMFLKRPWLTQRMKRITISHERFEQVFKVAVKFSYYASKMSLFYHPKINSRPGRFICGFAIVLSGAFLSLPLPIPLSNFIPALSIALICIGLLEEDLILVIMGLSITIAVIGMGIFSYHLIVEKFPLLFS